MLKLTPAALPYELVWEILTWLPVKSLMRFKSVSRIWLSIILHPAFATDHRRRGRGGFRGLLLSTPNCEFGQTQDTKFYYLTLDGPAKQISHHLTVHHGGGRRMGSTETVDGLVCFYDRNHSYLFNIATRESLQLPDSAHESEAEADQSLYQYSYHLGYEPRDKLYKLIKICSVYILPDIARENRTLFVRNLNCQILTLNNGGPALSWRSIDCPPWQIRYRSMSYSNGVVYWWEPKEINGWSTDDHHLIAFNLSKEKFTNILIPGPRPQLIFGPTSQPLILSMTYRDMDAEALITTCHHDEDGGGKSKESVVKFSIPLPRSAYDGVDLPEGILPNGKVLVLPSMACMLHFPAAFYFHPTVLLYLYDPRIGYLEKIEIPKITKKSSRRSQISLPFPSRPCSLSELKEVSFPGCMVSNHQDNIISLRTLISH